jgi:tRNA (adenine37-N6)-methyltransferase
VVWPGAATGPWQPVEGRLATTAGFAGAADLAAAEDGGGVAGELFEPELPQAQISKSDAAAAAKLVVLMQIATYVEGWWDATPMTHPVGEPVAEQSFTVTPIGWVASPRAELIDDDWGALEATISLAPPWEADALAGLEQFSHLEIIFLFHRVAPDRPVDQSRHPRGRTSWPKVGIFAQRAKDRPNRLGLCTCELVKVSGTQLTVRGLDAVDGTPVLDIKPYMAEFAPRHVVRQPDWSHELMTGYF